MALKGLAKLRAALNKGAREILPNTLGGFHLLEPADKPVANRLGWSWRTANTKDSSPSKVFQTPQDDTANCH